MTMWHREVLVAAGIVILIVWLVSSWVASTSPAPTPSNGPSPTGAIGSGASTFEPTASVSPASTTEP